jgi:hypothetical protein
MAVIFVQKAAAGQSFLVFPPEMSNGIYFLLLVPPALDTGGNGKTVEKVLFLR